MQFAFTSEQNLIRETVDQLAKAVPAMEWARRGASAGQRDGLWRSLADAGFLSILAGDAPGDLGFVEAGCLVERLGRVLSPAPVIGDGIVAIELLKALAGYRRRRDLIDGIGQGRLHAVPLLGWEGAPFALCGSQGCMTISGRTAPVACAVEAGAVDGFILLVRNAAGERDECWWLPRAKGKAAVTALPVLDKSRAFSSVVIEQMDAGDAEFMGVLSPHDLQQLQAISATCLAAEMLGGADRVLELACTYAKERKQFGQPIGQFQSIKHMLADDIVLAEGLRSLVYSALGALQDKGSLQDCWAAKAFASDAYLRIAGDAFQVFGAMGFAEETEPHLFLKRAQIDRNLFGTVTDHVTLLRGVLFSSQM